MNVVRRSLLFSFAEKYGIYAINLAALAVISRLLTPTDLGVFAVAGAVTLVLEVVREFGIGTYLVQARELTCDNVRTAFTVALCLSTLGAALLFALSGTAAAFYHEPALRRIMPVLAVNFLLVPFSIYGMSALRRDMAFDSLATIGIGTAAVSAIVGGGFAFLGFGYMSLAWGLLASSGFRTLMAFLYRPHLWAFRPALKEWRDALSFGGYSAAASIINVLHDSLPQLMLGRILGPASVGLYVRASTLSQLPDRLVTSALQSVVLPALAERTRRGQDLKEPFLRSLTCVTALQWPLLLCLALLADSVVRILLGPQWLAVAPLLRIISLASLCLFPAFMTYPTMVAVGRVRDTLTMSLISLPPSIALIAAASTYGLEAVAAVQFVNAPLQVYVALRFVSRHVRFTWRDLALATRASAVVAACTVIAPGLVVILAGSHESLSYVQIIVAVVAAGVGWLIGLAASGHPLLAELQISAFLARRRIPQRS
jgi:O-antigen/teichoic acid export membrane protein